MLEEIWGKCPICYTLLYKNDLKANLFVCPKCTHHMHISARFRLNCLLDKQNRYEIGQEISLINILDFKDNKKYSKHLKEAMHSTNETDAIIVMSGTIRDIPVVVASFEFSFMAGSMGLVVGERFQHGVQLALEQDIPFICISASGGARIQENLLSLMQMAKTTAMLTKLSKACLPFISILTNPTMGGVSASFAFLGDIVIAEPKALIGFTGPTVIEQIIHEKLPEGFQRSEFLLKKGAIDMIVDRRQISEKITSLLSSLTYYHLS